MKTWIMQITLAAILLLVGYAGGHYNNDVVHAQGAKFHTSTIPRSWGHCVGALGGFFVLEDRAGTLRIVEANSGEIQIQANRN
jgi:hypothetical protein